MAGARLFLMMMQKESLHLNAISLMPMNLLQPSHLLLALSLSLLLYVCQSLDCFRSMLLLLLSNSFLSVVVSVAVMVDFQLVPSNNPPKCTPSRERERERGFETLLLKYKRASERVTYCASTISLSASFGLSVVVVVGVSE